MALNYFTRVPVVLNGHGYGAGEAVGSGDLADVRIRSLLRHGIIVADSATSGGGDPVDIRKDNTSDPVLSAGVTGDASNRITITADGTILFDGGTPFIKRVDGNTVAIEGGVGGRGLSITTSSSATIIDRYGSFAGNIGVQFLDTVGILGRTKIGDNSSSNPTGQLEILTSGAATNSLVVKAAAAQTANLQEWRNSAGTMLTKVSSAGDLTLDHDSAFIRIHSYASGGLNRFMDIKANNAFGTAEIAGSTINVLQHRLISEFYKRMAVYAETASQIPLTIQGTAAQTANLQEWKDSAGTALASVSPAGTLALPVTATPSTNSMSPIGDPDTGINFSGGSNKIKMVVGGNVVVHAEMGAGAELGFYGANPVVKPTGVAVTAEAIHAALVSLGLIAA